ncbi:unnamed protein product [Chondrus crispus]|uniref:BZIP domain-containing protein n=1 Tax=Chondrus crispus TaxID=2769 RepID=R7Q314_CHOCR|nr:unnamed protein product [Chondrus crispus]CDF32942.1 unnamed protein product [Chondrus crispus]|eukprot:XP_005712745.1 unnamed protein product [Chondrus crispus]
MSPAGRYPIPFTPPLSEADHLLLEDATSKLRSTLRLPTSNPLVARWLFSNHTSAFHADAARLPPSVFSDSLVLRISTDVSFTPSGASPFASPFAPLAKPATRSAHLHLLLVPAAHADGLVLGYSAALGDPLDRELYPFESPPGFLPKGLMRGRFAFCPAQKHMVCVVNDLSPDVMGIIGLDWFEHNRRNRYFFTVPNRQYDFHTLPTRVLALLQNIEFKVAGAEEEWFARHHRPREGSPQQPHARPAPEVSPLASLVADLAEEHTLALDDDAPEGEPELPDLSIWNDDFLGALDPLPPDDGPPSPTKRDAEQQRPSPGPMPPQSPLSTRFAEHMEIAFGQTGAGGTLVSTSTSAAVAPTGRGVDGDAGFDLTTMFHSLLDLERSLEGKYFAPRMSRDIMNPHTGEIVARTTGEMRASLQLAKTKDARMLRELTAQTYYAITLPVTNDARLAFPRRPEFTWQQTGQQLPEGGFRGIAKPDCRPGESCLVRKRPRNESAGDASVGNAMEVCVKCIGQMSEVGASVVDQDAIREAKMEAKRRKNRLSAARSNHRKKERLEAQKKELLDLKERMALLQGRKEMLVDANSVLRQQVGTQE